MGLLYKVLSEGMDRNLQAISESGLVEEAALLLLEI